MEEGCNVLVPGCFELLLSTSTGRPFHLVTMDGEGEGVACELRWMWWERCIDECVEIAGADERVAEPLVWLQLSCTRVLSDVLLNIVG